MPRTTLHRSKAATLDLEAVLPRLVSAYETGRLVPFIGAGMSMPAQTGWAVMAQRLEESAQGKRSPRGRWKKDTPPEEIVRRANRAVRKLKAKGKGNEVFEAALGEALQGTAAGIPAQTRALARLWWPLVLSTNYDSLFAQAFHRQHAPRKLDLCGRSPADCQAVLHALTSPSRSILWALQGFLGKPPKNASPRRDRLRTQLVVGHDEYRRVTYSEQHFRRAFAEVFRSRSLLFLGSGIRETYLQELFGEVLEIYGPSARPHYAFMPRGEVDVDFMLARFQILVVEYARHDEVPRMLVRLARAVAQSHRPIGWVFGRARTPRAREWRNEPDLEVCRGPLPLALARGECLALSAGGSGRTFALGRSIQPLLPQWGVRPTDRRRKLTEHLAVIPRRHVFLARARSEGDERGLEHIYQASLDLFEHAARGHRRVRMQLLAAGGTEKRTGEPDWRLRTFPERYSFIQIVRAFADWQRKSKGPLQLALHLVTPAVYMEIASGRIDVLELVSCRDIRFWAEVVSDGEISERRVFQVSPRTTLAAVVETLNLPREGWDALVEPAPNLLDEEADPSVDARWDRTLERLGVVPDSTLRFQRAGTREERSI